MRVDGVRWNGLTEFPDLSDSKAEDIAWTAEELMLKFGFRWRAPYVKWTVPRATLRHAEQHTYRESPLRWRRKRKALLRVQELLHPNWLLVVLRFYPSWPIVLVENTHHDGARHDTI